MDACDPFKKRGIHILHLKINGLLPNIDKLRETAAITKVSFIGISESKLDNSNEDKEIDIGGCSILRCGRNRHGGGVACYIKNKWKLKRTPVKVNTFKNSNTGIQFDNK